MRRSLFAVPLVALALGLASCGDDDDETTAAGEPTTAEESGSTDKTVTTEAGQDPPLVGGFYDGKDVNYLLTDVSTEKDAAALSEATGFPVSFVASLGDVPESATAKLYLFMNGVEGPNPFGFQPNVIDSVPGDPGYSPLWLVHAVTWENESDARELLSEEEILDAEQNGELTIEPTDLVKNSPVVP